MNVLQWFTENWYFVLTGIVLIVVGGMAVFDFLQLPRKNQIAQVKQWLLIAVVEAEKQLGGGTGALKLRKVYDWFVERFPVVAHFVSFEVFAKWVDDALEEMQDMLKNNENVQRYIRGDTNDKHEAKTVKPKKLWGHTEEN